jgi:hypothetical protein
MVEVGGSSSVSGVCGVGGPPFAAQLEYSRCSTQGTVDLAILV